MKAETDTEQLILMLHSARELLSAGVTTARDLGARSFLDIAVRAAVDSGMAEGPRLVTAARPLTPTGGHCWFMGGECDALTLRDRFGDALEKVIMGLYSGGAQIIAGTDSGIDNCPHDAYVSGLEALAMVGLPATEILEAATLRAARALGVDDRTGTIEPGKDADLIAVRGDPRSDLSVLQHVELVVARGAEHRPAPRCARPPAGPPPSEPHPGTDHPGTNQPGTGPSAAGPALRAGAVAAPAGPGLR